MTEREELIEYAAGHLCDMVPHDDPNYWESLRELCEQYADMMLDNGFTLNPPQVDDTEVELEDMWIDYEPVTEDRR
jgi:hypothetical protein